MACSQCEKQPTARDMRMGISLLQALACGTPEDATFKTMWRWLYSRGEVDNLEHPGKYQLTGTW